MLLAPVLQAAPREIAGRLADELRASWARAGARRGRGAGLPQPVPERRLVPARAGGRPRRRRALRRGRRRAAREDPGRVRLRQPDGAAARPPAAATPPTATRSRASSSSSATTSRASTTSTTAGTQIANFGRSVKARARGEEVPEDGYDGEYVATLAAGDRGRGGAASTRSAPRPSRCCSRDQARRCERYGVAFDIWFCERTLHEGDRPARSSSALDCSSATGTSTAPRARCGCARPTSATTRTA